jgi:hypothetical protein
MITTTLARSLRAAGLQWRPSSGDAFRIDTEEFEGDVFTVSDMAIEPHRFDTGTILGFNGTTEWALDSVAIERVLWLPREDQLRELLGDAFRGLTRIEGGGYVVETTRDGVTETYESDDPAIAYAEALLVLTKLQAAAA